jgi:DNA invertase Pin-like site-specific DNA recombinase
MAAAGCDQIREEAASGKKGAARPVFTALMGELADGDTLTVWKLDRLGRSAREVLFTVDDLRTRGVLLRSITEGVDGTTPAGRAFIGILAVLAELERDILLERVHAGIAISRAEGRHGRRPAYDIARVRHASDLIRDGASIRTAARQVGLPRSTLADALARLPPALATAVG